MGRGGKEGREGWRRGWEEEVGRISHFHGVEISLAMSIFTDDMGLGSVVGSMNLPTHGFGGKDSGDDDALLRSGLSGETLTGGKRGGSLVKRLFRRMGVEDGGKSDGSC